MKVLILSVTAGEGHNSTAKALRDAFEAENAECTILDTFQYVSPAIAKFLSEGYLLVTEKAKQIYKAGYRLTELRKSTEIAPSQLVDLAFAGDIADYIHTNDFDVILFTHSFAGMILDYLKEREMITQPTIGILTDFTFHPYWEDCTHNDYVVIPDKALLIQGLRKGFREEQLLPYGIPIRADFLRSIPQAEARARLHLDPALPTILVMGGSMGYGKMGQTVESIDRLPCLSGSPLDFQMIVVCGNNKDMKKQLDTMVAAGSLQHKTIVTGFVNYIPLLMDASDCIITKPGGLTTSESLAKSLPMVIVNPIPGQEERNCEFLLNNGAACAASNTCPVAECLFQLLSSPERQAAMRSCVQTLAKKHAAQTVARFAIDLAHTPHIAKIDL